MIVRPVLAIGSILCSLGASYAHAQPVDLLERYPTKLTRGDAQPDNARSWEFGQPDIYRVSRFSLAAGQGFRVETGPATLGIGHCADGAVWAALIPRESGKLVSPAAPDPESISHLWLRFHPKEIRWLFPPDTVSPGGAPELAADLRGIADHKFTSSWHSGGQAMIPEPKDLTVDADTKQGLRRFFVVNKESETAEYYAAFENRPLRKAPALTAALAGEAFDKLWDAFDRDYAMFVLRPEVNWLALREQFRPKALDCQRTEQFAAVCAEMLKPLRDLHVWLTVAGRNVPVFNRPRSANSNPSAHEAILGKLNKEGRVQWTITTDKIGFMAIYSWSDRETPEQCDRVLEQLRDTRGLVLDVRLNGGGSEDLAMEVAGRFLEKPFLYAYSQFRDGPVHTALTEKVARTLSPRGPWRYNRPVVVLIGQKCMSSNESFVAMMSGDPDAVTMGDHTCGSSGNPEIISLPMEMTVSVPRWIDYLPDGTLLDERGFAPAVAFKPEPGAFSGERDDLLSAALRRLR
jgi:hypothetical protein